MKHLSNPGFQYIGLSILCLLTFGVFNTELLAFYWQWRVLVLILVLVPLLIPATRSIRRDSGIDGLSLIALLYATAILVVALCHQIALLSLPGSHPLNSVGHTVAMWRTRNLDFTTYYLFLPAAFLFHRHILEKCNVVFILKVLCALSMISAGVLLFQAFFAHSFLHKFEQDRYGGLATDLNAFALSAFWIVPMSLIGFLREDRLKWRIFFLSSLATVGAASAYTGTRTVFAGLLLLAILLAIGLAVLIKKTWIKVSLVSLGCIGIAAILMSPRVFRFLSESTSVAAFDRVDRSFREVKQIGVRTWWNRDPRGTQFKLGWGLVQSAPLAGWGPGGFYREASNETFRQGGIVEDRPDSALNHYLMIAGDLGLPGLLLNLLLLAAPWFVTLISMFAESSGRRMKLEKLILVLTGAIFMLIIFVQPPAYFPDTLWIWTAMLAFGAQEGKHHSRPISQWLRRPAYLGSACIFFVLITLGSFRTSFGALGYEARVTDARWPMRDNYGMYAWESGADGEIRWLSAKAGVTIRPTSDIIEFDLQSQPYNSDPLGRLRVAISVDDVFSEEIRLPGPRRHHVALYVPDATGRNVNLKIAVPSTFNLAKMGISSDGRDLGVMMSPIKYRPSPAERVSAFRLEMDGGPAVGARAQ